MLKANVGLSRKVSRDYQSTGYSVNIESEILSSPDNPEEVLGRVQELFSIAEAALQTEIDRDQGEQAIGRRDEEPAARQPAEQPVAPQRPAPPPAPAQPRQPANHQPRPGNGDAATPKQVQFIQNLAKRQRLSTAQLEGRIREALGQPHTLHQLTKKQAGLVIDAIRRAARQQRCAGMREQGYARSRYSASARQDYPRHRGGRWVPWHHPCFSSIANGQPDRAGASRSSGSHLFPSSTPNRSIGRRNPRERSLVLQPAHHVLAARSSTFSAMCSACRSGPPPAALTLGSAIHQALAAYHCSVQQGQPCGLDEVRTVFCQAWQARKNQVLIVFANGTEQATLDQGIGLLEMYLRQPPPEQILAVEQELVTPLVNSRGEVLAKQLIAVLDLVIRGSDGIEVIDIKTSARSYSAYDAQLSLPPHGLPLCRPAALRRVRVVPLPGTGQDPETPNPAGRHRPDAHRLRSPRRLGGSRDPAVTLGIHYPVESPMHCSTLHTASRAGSGRAINLSRWKPIASRSPCRRLAVLTDLAGKAGCLCQPARAGRSTAR